MPHAGRQHPAQEADLHPVTGLFPETPPASLCKSRYQLPAIALPGTSWLWPSWRPGCRSAPVFSGRSDRPWAPRAGDYLGGVSGTS